MRRFPPLRSTSVAVLAFGVATSCASLPEVEWPQELVAPPAAPEGRAWLECPAETDEARTKRGKLGAGADRDLELDGHRVAVPVGLTPPRDARMIVHPSPHLFVTVDVTGGEIPGGAALELSLERCTDAIPDEGFLYLYRFRGGPAELVDSASVEELQSDPVIRTTIDRFSGFVIAG